MSLIKISLLAAFVLAAIWGYAQTPSDGIFMEKGQICAAAIYNRDAWDEYWEGTLLRENANVGTLTNQNVQAMASIGVTSNFNVILNLPYVWTKASGGTLAGQHGLQDFGLWAKWRPFSRKIGPGKFNLIAEGGLSSPVSKYANDLLPLSIGLGSKTASLRGMLNYYLENGPYLNLNWGYTFRKNIELQREFYYSDGPHYTSELAMPNTIDYAATLGFLNKKLKLELTYAQMITQGGADIRRQDAPLASNRMIAGRASVLVQYYLSKPKGLSLIAYGGQTLSGRNVGKGTGFGGGVAYQFTAWTGKKSED